MKYISQAIVLWIVALAIFFAIRATLGELGEIICTVFLIIATSGRFGCSFSCRPNLHASIPGANRSEDATQERLETSESNAVESNPSTNVTRLAYLDNIKTFLTALVVTHHVNCAFGGGVQGSWFLIVGLGGDGPFTRFLEVFASLNQAFFMPLFFFISAYFVPSSYAKKGWQAFRQGRKRRILLPALFSLFVITPACVALGGYVAGIEKIVYAPHPGVAWFLYWLLLFNWMYATMMTDDTSGSTPVENTKLLDNNTSGSTPVEKTKMPGTITRLLCGITVCGLALLPFLILTPGSLASMPVSIGSVTCDFLMFYLGVQAKKNAWLETSLVEQMDIHPIVLLFMVIGEGAGMAILQPMIEEKQLVGIAFICLAGLFCLDMSLLVLVSFQKYLNGENSVSEFFARAAYGVYLIHPIVVTGMTALYICICNKLEVDNVNPIAFGSENNDGLPAANIMIAGWASVNLASHAIVWPLSYGLTQLPALKNIL